LQACNLDFLLSTCDPVINMFCSAICWFQSASKFSQFEVHVLLYVTLNILHIIHIKCCKFLWRVI
jgi:hypothetical protein